jgi:NAD(P)-dependent dehydrogenase (short-subunit alcohol dehydrogenase family)
MTTANAPTSPRPIALITGGSRGLGRAMALHLAAAGTDSILTYRDQAAAAQAVVAEVAARGGRAVALPLDVSDSAGFPAFVAAVRAALAATWERDRFDVLVNNAGVGQHTPIVDTTEAEFDHLYRVHLKAGFFLTQALLPILRDGGRILNVSTGLTRFAFPNMAAYAMMKGGLEVLTRYLALELAPRRIIVNTIAPGAIATDFGGGAVRDNPGLNQMIAGQTALGRVGDADDIGAAVVALLGSGGGWINGQRVEVSGGIRPVTRRGRSRSTGGWRGGSPRAVAAESDLGAAPALAGGDAPRRSSARGEAARGTLPCSVVAAINAAAAARSRPMCWTHSAPIRVSGPAAWTSFHLRAPPGVRRRSASATIAIRGELADRHHDRHVELAVPAGGRRRH